MSMQDTLADMFTRIRNGQQAGKKTVSMPSSKAKFNMANVLKEEGYISDVEVEAGVKPILTVTLKYFEGKDYTNMFKVPGTDVEFDLATGVVEKVTGLFVPVFEAKVSKEPILKGMNRSLVKQELEAVETDQVKGPFVSVGSLSEVTTGGNWPPAYDKEDAANKKD